jgi:putative phage-type endonuclease
MITEEQRKARMMGIGGSDMSIILGLSTYKTPYVLYLEKKGLIESAYKETEQQYWGNKLEGVIRQHFTATHNIDVHEPETLIHPLYDFLRANVDGYIPAWNAVLEIKCSDKYMRHEWGDADSDAIPMQYLCQVAHYCAVTNADKAIIAVLIGGNEYREFTYIRDLELEAKLIDAASTFWKAVQGD